MKLEDIQEKIDQHFENIDKIEEALGEEFKKVRFYCLTTEQYEEINIDINISKNKVHELEIYLDFVRNEVCFMGKFIKCNRILNAHTFTHSGTEYSTSVSYINEIAYELNVKMVRDIQEEMENINEFIKN